MKRYICSKSTPVHFRIESVLSSESAQKDWLIQNATDFNASDFKAILASRWVITTDLSKSVGDAIQKAHSRKWEVKGVMDWDDVELVEELNSINGVRKFDIVF